MTLAGLFERLLRRHADAAAEIVIAELLPGVRGGSFSLPAAIQRLERRLAEALPERRIEKEARDVAARVDAHHRRLFFSALAKTIGATLVGGDDTTPSIGTLDSLAFRRDSKLKLGVRPSASPAVIADSFAKENVRLITSIRAELLPSIAEEVTRVAQLGLDPDEAADRLERKWRRQGLPTSNGGLKRRLRMITRDQVATLNSQITKARHEAAGIDEFVWTSQRDGRVRPLHREIDGETYSYAEGHPTEGLPGQPINCRCYPEAVVDRDKVLSAPGMVVLSETELVFA